MVPNVAVVGAQEGNIAVQQPDPLLAHLRYFGSRSAPFLPMGKRRGARLKNWHSEITIRVSRENTRAFPRPTCGGCATRKPVVLSFKKMARCVQCGGYTQLYESELPICLACVAVRSTPTRKPPHAERTLESINARLTASRAEYRKALETHSDVSKLLDALRPGHPDGTQALKNANRELSIATGNYQEALHEFLLFTNAHRRSG